MTIPLSDSELRGYRAYLKGREYDRLLEIGADHIVLHRAFAVECERTASLIEEIDDLKKEFAQLAFNAGLMYGELSKKYEKLKNSIRDCSGSCQLPEDE